MHPFLGAGSVWRSETGGMANVKSPGVLRVGVGKIMEAALREKTPPSPDLDRVPLSDLPSPSRNSTTTSRTVIAEKSKTS